MPRPPKAKTAAKDSTANLGFEADSDGMIGTGIGFELGSDYVLHRPSLNDSDWFRKDDDVRWQFGVPPKGNANLLSVNASN